MDKNFKGTKEEYIEFRKKKNEANRRYYFKIEVKKRKKEYSKKYRKENKEKIIEYGKELRKTKKYKERVKKWREENKEHLREYKRSEEYKIRKRIADKKYREKRKEKEGRFWMNEKERARHKKWYEDNIEHLKEIRKKYYKTENGIISYKRANHIRLAIKKNRETDLTLNKIKSIFKNNSKCIYCGEKEKLELDHIIPLSKGGSCMSNNIVVACCKCNRSKSNRDVFYWCKLKNIEVPRLVLKLLEEQNIKHLNRLYQI